MRYFIIYKNGLAREITRNEIYKYCDNPQFSLYGYITMEPCDMRGTLAEDEGIALICSVDAYDDDYAQILLEKIRKGWGIKIPNTIKHHLTQDR